jgi:hypothetical protein
LGCFLGSIKLFVIDVSEFFRQSRDDEPSVGLDENPPIIHHPSKSARAKRVKTTEISLD